MKVLNHPNIGENRLSFLSFPRCQGPTPRPVSFSPGPRLLEATVLEGVSGDAWLKPSSASGSQGCP